MADVPTIRIAIIGAGIAGLVTAVELHNIFRSYTEIKIAIAILESENRAGGRIASFRLSSTDYANKSVAIDIGSNSFVNQPTIQNQSIPITIFRDQLGLHCEKLCNSIELSDVYDYDGSQVSKNIVIASKEYCKRKFQQAQCDISGEISDTIRKNSKDLSDIKNLGVSIAENLDKILHKSDFFSTLHPLHKRLVSLNLNVTECQQHSNLSNLSPSNKFIDPDCYFTIEGGLGQVTDLYEKHLSSLQADISIHYDKQVESIDSSLSHVVIKTSDGTIYNSNISVVTASAGVLQKNMIHFFPELPKEKVQAIKGLKMGIVNRVVLVFPYPFWGDAGSFHYINGPEIDNVTLINGCHVHFKVVKSLSEVSALIATIKSSETQESKSDDELISQIMNILAIIFSFCQPLPMPIETVVTRWGKNELSFGSSCYLSPNQNHSIYQTLSQHIDNRIFFAGDCTNSQFPGTVTGAILSGMKAASEIAIEILGKFSKLNMRAVNSKGSSQEVGKNRQYASKKEGKARREMR